MKAGYDTLVIGGGLVGAAIAYGLSREGEKVAVLDEGDVAFRASRGNFGLVWVQSKGDKMPEYAHWTRRSADLWPDFAAGLAEETGISPDYHKPGGVHFCFDKEELDSRKLLIQNMSNIHGIDHYGTKILDRQEVVDLVPGIGPSVIGASWSPHDGHASPLRLLRGLHAAIAGRGGEYYADGRAGSISKAGNGFRVKTTSASFYGDKVVLAAGLGNRELAGQVGLNIPISPLKGQILVTERVRPFLSVPTHVIRQTEEGSVMMGDSHEDVGFDTRAGTNVIESIAANAVRSFPLLGRLRVVRTWAALRIMSPDGFPIYQESQTFPGVFSINCHSGVTLAGAHALALAPLISRGLIETTFPAFSSRRFDVSTH